jgi:hypothetical protein
MSIYPRIYFKIETQYVIIVEYMSKCSQLSRAGLIMRRAMRIMRIEQNTSLRAYTVAQVSHPQKFYMTRLCLLLK